MYEAADIFCVDQSIVLDTLFCCKRIIALLYTTLLDCKDYIFVSLQEHYHFEFDHDEVNHTVIGHIIGSKIYMNLASDVAHIDCHS